MPLPLGTERPVTSTGPTEARQIRLAFSSSSRKMAPASTLSSFTICASASRTVASMSWVWANERLSAAANSNGSVIDSMGLVGWLMELDIGNQSRRRTAEALREQQYCRNIRATVPSPARCVK